MLALFAAGHTLGTAAPHVRRGAPEAAVFQAMQAFHFPVMGFNRTYWDFYRGFALIISVQLAVMAVIAWQAGTISRRHPREVLPLAVTLQLACLALLIVSWLFFFGGPVAMSAAAVFCSTVAVILLRRQELRKETSRAA